MEYRKKVNTLHDVVGSGHYPFKWEGDTYSIFLNGKMIRLFVNDVDLDYDVTVDAFGGKHFDANLEWMSFDNPYDALRCFHKFVEKYV